MARPRPKPRRGPAPLSDDRFDKFIAAMCCYVGRSKDDPEFARAPHYYAAVSECFDRLCLDHQATVHIVHHSTPGYGGEAAAMTYAAGLPSVPVPPEARRGATNDTD